MKLKDIKSGMRIKTLPASIVPILIALGVLKTQSVEIDYFYISMCVGLALFIQIATNFYNDVIDFKKGADEKRVGPTRITNEKNLKFVMMIGHLFLMLAFLCGISLVLKGGVIIFIIGVISLYFAYGYTGGPFPLAYLGLGELFVFIFFGLVATVGSYYINTGDVNLSIVLAGSQAGLLSCVLIAINNLRDIDTDKIVNKNTLATKLGKYRFKNLINLFLFTPYVLLLYFILFVSLKYFIVLFAIGFAHRIKYIIDNYNDNKELNSALELSGKHLVAFGILFLIGSAWS